VTWASGATRAAGRAAVAGITVTAALLGAAAAGPSPALAAGTQDERAGATVTGCRGELTSRDSNGRVLDRAAGEPPHRVVDPDDGEETFTADHPFVVARDGTVDWSGATTSVITDQDGSVRVWGISVADHREANDGQADAAQGTFDLADVAWLPDAGLVKIDASLRGSGGECLASGWIRLDGNPLPTLAALVALALTVAGGALLVVAQPRQRPPATTPR
jgi:hypothetical protein